MSIDVRDDKKWLTAAEAAAEQLPGLPTTKRHLNRLITENAIRTRKREARGGGREFHWTDLPSREARDAYLKRYGVQHAEPVIADPAARAANKDLLAEARAQIVDAAETFLAERALPTGKGLKTFLATFNRGRVRLDPWVRQVVTCVELHQLKTWRRIWKAEGTEGLQDRRGRPASSGMFDTDLDLKNYVIARFAERPHLSATQFKALIELPRPEGLGRVVALRTLQLFLAPLRKSAMAKALVDPDKYRSHHKPAFGSLSQNVVRINQKWEIDASPADVMCLENGSPVRKKLMALIDVFTRRAVVLVVDQPSGNGTKALLRRAMLQWGMPELVKADNGKEFKNLAVERFCRDAGIALELSRKFSPEEKGHIERFFETLSHGLLPLLPGFIGHDVAMRKGIENRKSFAHRFGEDAEVRFEVELSPEGLQARIDAWLRDVYEQNHHGGLALRPCDKALAHAGDVRRIGDERDLDALMLVAPDAHGIRIVRKKGIAIANRHYVAPELGGLMGERVQCRFDPFDPSRIAVFTADASRFLCVAEDPAVIAPDRMVRIAKEAQAIDRSRIRAIRDGARKVLQLHPGNVGDALLTNAAGNGFIPLDDSARDAMRFAQAPRLVAAREGFDAIDDAKLPPQPIPVSEDAAAAARDVMAELEARNTKPAVRMLQCDGYERPAFENDVEFWRWAKDWRAQGRELDAQDKSDIADLSLSPAFAAMLANDDARRAHTA